MGKADTVGQKRVGAVLVLLAAAASAQTPAPASRPAPEWRHVGNSSIELGLAGLASGAIEQVWYSPDGTRLRIRTASGKLFETSDFDKWQPAGPEALTAAAPSSIRNLARFPETGVVAKTPLGQTSRAYAVGKFAYRSEDLGANWNNLSAFRGASILGDGLRDLAIAPRNEDDVVVAGAAGVFRSVDGGLSWSGLNQGLPNLPVVRIRGLPAGDRGARLELSDGSVVEWQPGERTAWRLDSNWDAETDRVLREAFSGRRGTRVTAVAQSGDFLYLGTVDGRINASADRGQTWPREASINEGGAVTSFWVNPQDPRVVLAVLDFRQHSLGIRPMHVLRTLDGGTIWDDLTSDLPDAGVYGVAADSSSGVIYVATDRGVYFTRNSLSTATMTPTPWTLLGGLPEARAVDVRLDGGGNQLWAALEGYGLYSTLAPHRIGDPRVVSSADFVARAAAPGALMSVLGARVESARAGNQTVPVLDANDNESQIQIPFGASGESLALSIDTAGTRRQLPLLPLGPAAPGIIVVTDGAPMVLDADNGVILDAMHPAHSRARIQILATGLGRVTPDWPDGTPAPLENPPQVAARVQAWLDRSPVEVTRAVLAPSLIATYLIEIEIPKIVNYGPAELYIEASGQASNRVRIYIEP